MERRAKTFKKWIAGEIIYVLIKERTFKKRTEFEIPNKLVSSLYHVYSTTVRVPCWVQRRHANLVRRNMSRRNEIEHNVRREKRS